MDMLKLALVTRLPFIHVKTDDVLHIPQILSHLAGTEAMPLPSMDYSQNAELPSGDVFYTSMDLFPQKLYLKLKADKKTVVFVNTKISVLHFVGGTMLPPKEMVRAELLKHTDEENADEILSAFGGMTLKDTYEIIRLTLQRHGELTAKGVNRVRQSYVTKLKGITQVDSDYLFYQVPSYLSKWADTNLPFFVDPVHESLTPRGLLFDGPPGTGKTMGAKYLANTLGMPLYRLDIGAMKGKYVGDSEGNLNAALTQIDQAAPCVVLLDEVEKIFTGSNGDAGVTSSLLSTLLWWLQEHKTKVFPVMTTNNVKGIPPELYREGRIDTTMVFQGLETIGQATEFCYKVMSNLQNSIGAFSDLEVHGLRTAIGDNLAVKFSDGQALPQAQATQMVNDLVKAMIAARKDPK